MSAPKQENKTIKIWLPYVKAGSGTDVFTQRLAQGFRAAGLEAIEQEFPHRWQYFPWRLKYVKAPENTDIILTNSWNGFAFKRPDTKLVVLEHHCVFDPVYKKYRNPAQACYHEMLVRFFEKWSFQAADAVIAVSEYTAQSLKSSFKDCHPFVIYNGIETEYFCPDTNHIGTESKQKKPYKLLFVGNLSKRKGADLLPAIMDELGNDFHLCYTAGLRADNHFSSNPRMTPLSRLSRNDLRQAYREADLFVFPSRFEGFGYAPVEAMSCGTPVVAAKISALPEVIEDKRTGMLCTSDNVSEFAETIKKMVADQRNLSEMGKRARQRVVNNFSLDQMAQNYKIFFQELLKK